MESNNNHESLKKPFIINSYYQGISTILTSEIDYLTAIINHRGTKGQANEELLKTLLMKFLPKKYSIGSGILFDRDGNSSKQIDIVIYDATHQPEILGHGSQYLFPVDIVYCIIEVKTVLDKSKLKEAIENIKSVKRLNFIRYEDEKDENCEYKLSYKFKSASPFSVIFSYISSTNKIMTFISWTYDVLKEMKLERREVFEGCYVFDNTFSIRLPNLEIRDFISFDFCHLLEDDSKNNRTLNHRIIYNFHGKKQECDKGRGFLIFLSSLLQMLSLKETYKGPLLKKYFPEEYDLQTGSEINLDSFK